MCVLIVEPAKLAVPSFAARNPRRTYCLLVVYQIILFGDTIKAHAFDWWKWLLSLVGAATLTPATSIYEVAGFRFPWISGVVALATRCVLFWSLLQRRKPPIAAPPDFPGSLPSTLGDRSAQISGQSL